MPADSKHVLVIAAGAADEPVEMLDGRTPLEAASTPALDEIAACGRPGNIRTIPPGFAASRDVATLALFGYDVRDSYSGYAGLEALGRRIILREGELAFRVNLVTVTDGVLVSPAAGGLSASEAFELVAALDQAFTPRGRRFHAGLAHRALMVTKDPWDHVVCTPAHDMIGERIDRHRPGGRGGRDLFELMQAADAVLAAHPVNRARIAAGRAPANAIWPWGQGVLPRLRRFRQRWQLRAAAVGAVDLFRGISRLAGLSILDIPGATGDVDTDFAAKADAALAALDDHDVVLIHVEAPYEASMAGDVPSKIRAIEQIDAQIVRPLFDRVRRSERWSCAFVADLPVSADRRRQSSEPPPLCFAGSAVAASAAPAFGETAARRSDLHIDHGWDFMEYFLRV